MLIADRTALTIVVDSGSAAAAWIWVLNRRCDERVAAESAGSGERVGGSKSTDPRASSSVRYGRAGAGSTP